MAKKSIKLEITYKNFITESVGVTCGEYLALSMAKGLIKEKDNIANILIIDRDSNIFAAVRCTDIMQ